MSSFELYAVDRDSLDSTKVHGTFTEIQAKDAAKNYATANNLKITRGVQLMRNFSMQTAPDDFRYTFLVTPKASSVSKTSSVSKAKSVARGKRTVGKKSAKKRSVRRLR